MAGQKFIRNSSGRYKELAAIQSSAGAGDAGKIAALDAGGKWDITMMPTGVGPQTATIVASEALSAGALVNVWDNSGTTNVRNADATATGKEANGFVLSSVSNGANATVYFNGENNAVTGLARGLDYYLSTTPGAVTSTAPSTAGNVVQPVGRSISTTELVFNPLTPLELV